MSDVHDRYIIPHSKQLTELDGRLHTMEEDIRDLKAHDIEHYDNNNEVREQIASIIGSLKILVPIVYSVLGVSVLAFIAQLFNQFAK